MNANIEYNTEKVVELVKLAFPLNRSEVAGLTDEERKKIKTLAKNLPEHDKKYLNDTIDCLNNMYMIYTADHSYEYARDVKTYEDGIKLYNDTYPMQFTSYETSVYGTNNLKPTELQNATGFRYSGLSL